VEGLIDELTLELSAFGDVAGRQHDAAQHGVVGEVGAGGLGVAPDSAAMTHAHLEMRGRRGRARHVAEERLE